MDRLAGESQAPDVVRAKFRGLARVLAPVLLAVDESSLADRCDALRKEIRRHLDDYVAPSADSPVFTRKTGRPLRRRDLSEAWRVACFGVGIQGAHVHDLRHHAATTAAGTGITTRELMARIGFLARERH